MRELIWNDLYKKKKQQENRKEISKLCAQKRDGEKNIKKKMKFFIASFQYSPVLFAVAVVLDASCSRYILKIKKDKNLNEKPFIILLKNIMIMV